MYSSALPKISAHMHITPARAHQHSPTKLLPSISQVMGQIIALQRCSGNFWCHMHSNWTTCENVMRINLFCSVFIILYYKLTTVHWFIFFFFPKSIVQVETLGEFGVFFTLFLVGLEFSPERLRKVIFYKKIYYFISLLGIFIISLGFNCYLLKLQISVIF